MGKMEKEEYLDYEELCQFLHIARGTARNWKCAGKISYTHFNNKIYFPKKLILKKLKNNVIKSTSSILE